VEESLEEDDGDLAPWLPGAAADDAEARAAAAAMPARRILHIFEFTSFHLAASQAVSLQIAVGFASKKQIEDLHH
jgi:hypothetical protein